MGGYLLWFYQALFELLSRQENRIISLGIILSAIGMLFKGARLLICIAEEFYLLECIMEGIRASL